MNKEQIPTLIDHFFQSVRSRSKRIAKLENRLAQKAQQRETLAAGYRDEVRRIASEIQATRTQLQTEEAIVRRNISRAILAGRDPSSPSGMSRLDPAAIERILQSHTNHNTAKEDMNDETDSP